MRRAWPASERLAFERPDALRFQSATQRAEFGYRIVPNAMRGSAPDTVPGASPEPWEIELLLEPSDSAEAEP